MSTPKTLTLLIQILRVLRFWYPFHSWISPKGILEKGVPPLGYPQKGYWGWVSTSRISPKGILGMGVHLTDIPKRDIGDGCPTSWISPKGYWGQFGFDSNLLEAFEIFCRTFW